MDTMTADFLLRSAIRRAVAEGPDTATYGGGVIAGEALCRARRAALTRVEAADLEWVAVREARAEGASWSEIGRAIGISRQAAQMRFGE